jgi:5'-nucleotidase
LKVTLNAEGEPTEWSGSPKLLTGTSFRKNGVTIPAGSDAHAGIVRGLQDSGAAAFHEENTEAQQLLETYAAPLQEMMRTTVAEASRDLVRGDNAGPGPLVADAMLWKTRSGGAQIAVQNTGGIRRDLPAGPISVAAVYELLPFNNTLVLLDLKGSEFKAALEDAVNYQLATGSKSPYLYVSGAMFGIAVSAPKGSRITNLRVRLNDEGYAPIDPAKTYRIVTNNYLARGGDGIQTFGSAAGYRIDTGFTDAEVFLEYLRGIGTIQSPSEKRISFPYPAGLRKAA